MMTLETIITNLKGCKVANLVTKTEVKGIKTFAKKVLDATLIEKVTDKQVQLNSVYQNRVNNKLDREGLDSDFIADKLPYGTWYVPNKIIQTTSGALQLRYYLFNSTYRATTIYLIDGKPATEEQTKTIKAFLDSKTTKNSEKQAAHGLTDDKQIVCCNVGFDNILQLKVDGQIYVKEGAEELLKLI